MTRGGLLFLSINARDFTFLQNLSKKINTMLNGREEGIIELQSSFDQDQIGRCLYNSDSYSNHQFVHIKWREFGLFYDRQQEDGHSFKNNEDYPWSLSNNDDISSTQKISSENNIEGQTQSPPQINNTTEPESRLSRQNIEDWHYSQPKFKINYQMIKQDHTKDENLEQSKNQSQQEKFRQNKRRNQRKAKVIKTLVDIKKKLKKIQKLKKERKQGQQSKKIKQKANKQEGKQKKEKKETDQITKNLLSFAQPYIVEVIGQARAKEYVQSYKQKSLLQQTNQMIQDNGSQSQGKKYYYNMNDFDRIFKKQEFHEKLDRFFKKKVLYRKLMLSRVQPENKIVYLHFLGVFERNFRAKKFQSISVPQMQIEKELKSRRLEPEKIEKIEGESGIQQICQQIK